MTVIGFCYSLGWNFFFYRILYDVLPFFRSMRVAVRGSMFVYLGLAILAGARREMSGRNGPGEDAASPPGVGVRGARDAAPV